jgi:AcrR family transcriptional regulator
MAIVNSRKPKYLNELTAKHIHVIGDFEELLEQGISRLTMSDIAAKLKVSLRTLYEIAPSKEHLITATMDRLLTDVGQEARASMQEIQSPMSKLKAYIKVGYEAVGPKIRKFHTDLSNVRGVVETLDYHRDYFIGQIEELLDEAVKHKEIKDTDTHVVAIALGAVPLLLSDYFYHRESYQRELGDRPESSAHLVADLILESLEQI